MKKNISFDRNLRRKRRISANIFGTKDKPRFSVFVSNRYIYLQAIDDEAKKTIISSTSLTVAKEKDYKKSKKTEEANKVGMDLALKAKKIGILTGVFDRGRYSYLGRVKALAEGLRKGGLEI